MNPRHRLPGRRRIAAVRESGSEARSGAVRVRALPGESAVTRVAFAVPGATGAVSRNRARRRLRAAIVPILLYRNRYRVNAVVHPEIRYDPDAPRDAEVRKTAEVLLRIFEQAIRKHPEQWHVLDPIWPAAGTR